jgi:hypothetical protein
VLGGRDLGDDLHDPRIRPGRIEPDDLDAPMPQNNVAHEPVRPALIRAADDVVSC